MIGLVVAIGMGCAAESARERCPLPDEVDCSAAHDVDATIEVGTGDAQSAAFEPLPEDGRVLLHYGPEGGYYFSTQARVRGLCPNSVIFTRFVQDPVLRRESIGSRLVPDGDDWILAHAQPTFLCPSNEPGVALADRPVDLEVTVEEDLGSCDDALEARSVSTTVTIIPTCTEGDLVCSEDWMAGCAAPP